MTKANLKEQKLVFPKNLLNPVSDFLTKKLSALRLNKKKISTEDPFNDKTRDFK